MSRTILYYPYIDVPATGTWIRGALLYWDKIAAVVPRSYDDYQDSMALARYSAPIQDLYEREIFRPINPSRLVMAPSARRTEFESELVNRMVRLKKLIGTRPIELDVEVYRDKLSDRCFSELERLELAREGKDWRFYYFEPRAAQLYMSLLAKYLAETEEEPTITATDKSTICRAINQPLKGDERSEVLSVTFKGLVPVPHSAVKLEEIVRFREKYQDELLRFRAAMDTFDLTIESLKHKELLNAARAKRDDIVLRCSALEKALRGSKFALIFGSLQSFFKPTSPTLLGAGVVVAGKATSLANVPAELIVGGAAVAGAVELTMHVFKEWQARQKVYENEPFSYIYHARKHFA